MNDPRPWVFDDFVSGAVLGSATFSVDDAFVERWLALYASESDTRPVLPAGMAMLIIMRGYAEAVAPRPPGNVHAAQRLTIRRSPRVGEHLTTTVRCEDTTLKNGRRWTYLGVRTAGDDDDTCYDGLITTLWAC